MDPDRSRQERLRAEVSRVPFNPGARLRIVLAYPNRYSVGMSNLGLHTLYRLLNAHPEVCCERVFLPDPPELERYRARGTPLMSLETGRPVSDAHAIAFSASFENDYPNLLTLLDLAGLPLRAADREAPCPIVLMGGATVSINPEPVAPFLDVCCLGEGEELVAPLVESLLAATDRRDLLETLAGLPGFYVPGLYTPRYGDGDAAVSAGAPFPRFAGLDARDPAPPTVTRVRAALDRPERVASTAILTPHTEFGDRVMVEVARGCTKGCRYCWVGYNILPFRVHAVDDILAAVEPWKGKTDRVGLVATALLDHPEIEAIASGLRDRDWKVFSPSLIISTLREPLLKAVTDSGQRSVTIAPETGSDRLREVVMKRITNEEILAKVRMIFQAGALHIKNYIIVGLPGETQQDLEELVDLAAAMREVMLEEQRGSGRLGSITLSVNCLIPKPSTPFQWARQIPRQEYRRKLRWLRRHIGRLPNVQVEAMAPRAAEMQAVMSRGDRRVADLLEHLHRQQGSWRPAVRAWEADGGSLEHFAYRAWEPTDPLPWQHLRTSAGLPALRNQWEQARASGVDAAA